MTATDVSCELWRGLTMAACGHRVIVTGSDERDAARMFKECVAALEGINLDKAMWSAHKSNGNQRIWFENGGEVRFVSFRAHMDGTRAGMVVVDE